MSTPSPIVEEIDDLFLLWNEYITASARALREGMAVRDHDPATYTVRHDPATYTVRNHAREHGRTNRRDCDADLRALVDATPRRPPTIEATPH